MAVQTNYDERMAPGFEGGIVNSEHCNFNSKLVEDEGGIGFGKVVQHGASDEGITADLTGMTANSFAGITVRERTVDPRTPNKFGQYDMARVATAGVLFVMTSEAVSPKEIVTIDLSTGQLGKQAVSAGVLEVPNARWASSTTGTGLAKIRLG